MTPLPGITIKAFDLNNETEALSKSKPEKP